MDVTEIYSISRNTFLKVLKVIGNDHARFISWLLLIIAYYASADIEIVTAPNEYVLLGETSYFEIVWPESLMYSFKIQKARDFGTEFDRIYTNVELVYADPEEACRDLYNDVRGKVALILRGGCSFLTKSKIAERAGAIAAIISDNDETNDASLIEMIDDNTERVVHIPALFLMGKDGAMIRQKLNLLGSDYAIINIPVNLTGKPPNAAKQPPWTVW